MRRLWTLPADLLGLTVARLSRCRIEGGDGRALVARAPARSLLARSLVRRGFEAITIGRVIICCATPTLQLLQHELEHVRQWERWGPLFPVVYLAASAWAWARGEGAYRGNDLEEAARDAEES